MPRKEDNIAFDRHLSNCTNDAKISWDENSWSPSISNLTKSGTKCSLYFSNNLYLTDEVLKNESKETSIEQAKESIEAKGAPDFNTIATENEGLYMAMDDDGKSYYYRGQANNFVKFGDIYYRIIRINGDGSIRMIYNGPNTNQTGESTLLKHTQYNKLDDNPTYVGYMYKDGGNKNSDDVHANEVDSEVKKNTDSWYKNNIEDKSLTKYIVDAIFCNDRSIKNGSGNGYNLTPITYYGAYYRNISQKNPSLLCESDNDKFTLKTSEKGNKKLDYAVGLITADELALAGSVLDITNNKAWSYTGEYYWTMTPGGYNGFSGSAKVFYVHTDGFHNISSYVNLPSGLRPVINLKPNTIITQGDGSNTNPYIVKID